MTELPPSPRWQARRTQIAWRVFGDEGKLADLRTGTTHTLNPVASFLWEQLQERDVSASELLDALLAAYEVTRDVARQHVHDFVTQLAGLNLIEPAEGSLPVTEPAKARPRSF